MTTSPFNVGDRVVITVAERNYGFGNMVGVHGIVTNVEMLNATVLYRIQPDGGGSILCLAHEMRKE